MEKNKTRNVSVIKDADGNSIVMINDIIFKGKRSLNWEDVEQYLKDYVGDFYSIAEDGEIVFTVMMGKSVDTTYSTQDS